MESRPRVCGWDRQYPRPLRMGACQHQVPMLPCCRRLRTPAGLCYLRLRVPRYPLSPAVPCRPPGAVARRTRRLAHAHLQVAAGWLQVAARRPSPTAAATGIMGRRRSALRVPVPGLHSTPGLGSATGGPRKWGNGKMDLHFADHKSRQKVSEIGDPGSPGQWSPVPCFWALERLERASSVSQIPKSHHLGLSRRAYTKH